MEQILHANPIREDRKPTNTPFIIVLGLTFLTWLGNGIKAIVDASPEEVELVKEVVEHLETVDNKPDSRETGLEIIDGMSLKFTWSYVVCTTISGLIAIFYVYFLSLSRSKFVIEGSLYLLCVWMILILISNSILSSIFVANIFVHLGFLFSLTYAAYIVMSFRCARNVGTKEIFEIIKDSCRALCGCYAIPLFLFAVWIIISLIVSFTIYIFFCLLTSLFDDIRTFVICSFLNGICGVILVYFFVNFIDIVISGYVIDWYWAKDQQLDSMTFFKRNITRTLRYHLGTLAFSSIPFLSYICSVFQACKPRNNENDITKIYSALTRFCGQLCTFFYITDFALVQTSVYGHDYTTAIAAAHELVAQNNHEINIAVSEVCLMVARIGFFFIAIPFAYDRIHSTMYSVIIPFSIVFTSAVHALLVNKMIIDHASEALQKGHDNGLAEIIPTAESPETEKQPSVY